MLQFDNIRFAPFLPELNTNSFHKTTRSVAFAHCLALTEEEKKERMEAENYDMFTQQWAKVLDLLTAKGKLELFNSYLSTRPGDRLQRIKLSPSTQLFNSRAGILNVYIPKVFLYFFYSSLHR